MRRLLIAGLFATLFLVAHQSARTALAVNYAAGWNLVSGPEGSTLEGASGSIYTLQPGDTDYESFPANASLHGGYGYWAHFPNGGGSITFGASAPSLTITPVPGQYLMLGNPSQSVATVTGADSVLLYTPSGGYQSSTVIPPGQGAWVTGSGKITLTAAVDSAPVAAAPPPGTGNNTAAPTTFAALKAIALNGSDLTGYTQKRERPFFDRPELAVASYFSSWSSLRSLMVVSDTIITAFSASDAESGITVGIQSHVSDPTNFNHRTFAVTGVGETATGRLFNYRSTDGSIVEFRSVFVRRGVVVIIISVLGDPGATSADYAVSLARIIDNRLTGGPTGTVATTTAAPLVAAQPGGQLLTASGIGEDDTANFTPPSTTLRVCLTQSGRSASGSNGPSTGFSVRIAGTQTPVFVTGLVDDTPSFCKTANLSNRGNYYLHIFATPWTHWAVAVDSQ